MVAPLLRLIQAENLRSAIACHNDATWPNYDWEDVMPVHLQAYSEAIAKVKAGLSLQDEPAQSNNQSLRREVL